MRTDGILCGELWGNKCAIICPSSGCYRNTHLTWNPMGIPRSCMHMHSQDFVNNFSVMFSFKLLWLHSTLVMRTILRFEIFVSVLTPRSSPWEIMFQKLLARSLLIITLDPTGDMIQLRTHQPPMSLPLLHSGSATLPSLRSSGDWMRASRNMSASLPWDCTTLSSVHGE